MKRTFQLSSPIAMTWPAGRIALLALIAGGVLLQATPTFAASGGKGLDWVKMAVQLAGGLALPLRHGQDGGGPEAGRR